MDTPTYPDGADSTHVNPDDELKVDDICSLDLQFVNDSDQFVKRYLDVPLGNGAGVRYGDGKTNVRFRADIQFYKKDESNNITTDKRDRLAPGKYIDVELPNSVANIYGTSEEHKDSKFQDTGFSTTGDEKFAAGRNYYEFEDINNVGKVVAKGYLI